MKKIFLFIAVFFTLSVHAQILDPVKWQVTTKVTSPTTADIIFTATIDADWHVYAMDMPKSDELSPVPTQIVFKTMDNTAKAGKIQATSKLHREYDPNYQMELAWYNTQAVFVQKITFKDASKVAISGYIRYMVCNDKSCLPPTDEPFSIEGLKYSGNAAAAPAKDTVAKPPAAVTDSAKTIFTPVVLDNPKNSANLWQPVVQQLHQLGEKSGSAASTPLWLIFLWGLGWGFLALLTPCVWPIIPLTVSYFMKRSDNKKRYRKDAVLYGFSIVIIYLTLGLIITAIFGGSALNSMSTNAVFNIFLFALLVVLAISFFGAFDITLPSSWSTKLDEKAESTAGFVGIFLMAFVLALVSFSCTGPVIGILLAQISTTGNIIAPAVGMLGFAIALAIPFTLFAFFPNWLKSMPKSGSWLNSVKVTLAFLELAFALKFLSVADMAYGWRILDRETFLALWIVIFALLGFYLLGKLRFSHDSETKHTSVLGLFLGIISLAFAVYMVPGLWGAPLKSVSAFSPPSKTQDFNLYKDEVHAPFDDYDAGMAYAASVHKPVVIDFTGFGCVNCRKMEASVWINPTVKRMLENDFVLISLWVDDKTPLPSAYEVMENGKARNISTIGDKWSYLQRMKFGANAQPYYVALDNNGNPLAVSFAFTENPDEFIAWLKAALARYQ